MPISIRVQGGLERSDRRPVIEFVKQFVKEMRLSLRLAPAQLLLQRLRRCGLDPSEWRALEMFGNIGLNHTPIFNAAVRHMEIWDIKPETEQPLRQRFPQADIKITDSYVEIARTRRKYDLVISDNYAGMCFGHCEHMDMFPDVFRVLNDPGVIVLDVTPKIYRNKSREWAAERAARRQEFYRAQNPDRISFAEMEQAYRRLAAENNKVLKDCFFTRRWTFPTKEEDPYYYCTLVVANA